MVDFACYPNGVVSAVSVQVLSLIGLILSVLVVSDCHFVQLSELLVVQPEQPIGNGIGLFYYEFPNKGCNWDDSSSYSGLDYLETVLGSDWQPSRRLAVTTMILAFAVFVWTMTWSCCLQSRRLRYGFACLTIVLLPILLGASYRVHSSDLCNEYECKLGRSAYCGIAAIPIFVFFGLLLLLLDVLPDMENDEARDKVQPGALDEMLQSDKRNNPRNNSTETDDISKSSLSGIFARMTIFANKSSEESVSVITGDMSLERPHVREDPYRVYSNTPAQQSSPRRMVNV